MKYSERLMVPHFESLNSMDVLDLNDGYSRVLRPTSTIASAVLNPDNLNNTDRSMPSPVWRHVNYFTFRRLFESIDSHISRPVILETGSSAHGTNSSMLFAALAAESGGLFQTVDLNDKTFERVSGFIQEKFGGTQNLVCNLGDSVRFIRDYSGEPFNVVYLDSYDLTADCFAEAAWHGYQEFVAVLPKLCKKYSLILIDDTPASFEIYGKMASPAELAEARSYFNRAGSLPGKGQLVVETIKNDRRFEILAWEYQVLIAYREI